jgi:hypothetical protein
MAFANGSGQRIALFFLGGFFFSPKRKSRKEKSKKVY